MCCFPPSVDVRWHHNLYSVVSRSTLDLSCAFKLIQAAFCCHCQKWRCMAGPESTFHCWSLINSSVLVTTASLGHACDSRCHHILRAEHRFPCRASSCLGECGERWWLRYLENPSSGPGAAQPHGTCRTWSSGIYSSWRTSREPKQ